jgi:hypothetical protein
LRWASPFEKSLSGYGIVAILHVIKGNFADI